MSDRTALVIPTRGLMEWYLIDQDWAKVLDSAGGLTPYAAITLYRDEAQIGTVLCSITDRDSNNTRAMKAVLEMTGTHLLLWGPVVFYDLVERDVEKLMLKVA